MKCTAFACRVTAVLALLGATAAGAASIEVSPVIHRLAPARSALAMTVSNRGSEPVMVQLRPYDWTQDAGGDRLEPAPDVIVSPPMVSLEPGGQQVVRAWFPAAAPAHGRAWRMLIDEIPTAEGGGEPVRVALRLSVPVFRAAARPEPAGAVWTIDAATRRLSVANTGGDWLRLRALSLTDARGATLHPAAAGTSYVLPGARRAWSLAEAPLRPGDTLRLSAQTDAGPLDVPVVVRP
ncbi:MAG TPA: fimbria/pilus periplasmic chaperone [Methylibium sp.]|nr:fimbria/pilus periplasmic chaperone [Methylibium sp.]